MNHIPQQTANAEIQLVISMRTVDLFAEILSPCILFESIKVAGHVFQRKV